MLIWQDYSFEALSSQDILLVFVDFKKILLKPEIFSALMSELYPDEIERLQVMKAPKVKNQFAITRGLLRKILKEQFPANSNLNFFYTAQGKPYLVDESICFSISHTDHAGVLALSKSGTLGVDIEDSTRQVDYLSLAKTIFTKEEQLYLKNAENLGLAFFSCWTRKEAFIKAEGSGLNIDLKTLALTNALGELIKTYGYQDKNWFNHELPVYDHYLLALTASSDDCNVKLKVFNPD